MSHCFESALFSNGTRCEHCGELLLGRVLSCGGCRLNIHQKCKSHGDRLVCDPLHLPPSCDRQGHEPGHHLYGLEENTGFAYCAACKKYIWGGSVQRCALCRKYVHDNDACQKRMEAHRCRPDWNDHHVDGHAHEWSLSALAGVCMAGCGQRIRGQGLHFGLQCVRCSGMVHRLDCVDKIGHDCSLGPLRDVLVPPNAVSQGDNGLSVRRGGVVAFVNRKSGGGRGALLFLELLRIGLSRVQVFDLGNGGPREGLTLFKGVPGTKILACGGDGTACWLFSEMDKLYGDEEKPPLAVLPLGTGNDLARVSGWGGGYNGEPMVPWLLEVARATPVKLDRWTVKVGENEAMDFAEPEPKWVMNNYFSLGVDAAVSLGFHTNREAHPGLFTSRTVNKMWYVGIGAKHLLESAPILGGVLRFMLDDKELDLSGVKGIAVLNLQSYSGGKDLWGPSKETAFDDGTLEVVGFAGMVNVSRIQGKLGSAIRMGQGSHIRIEWTSAQSLACQVDGEAWEQSPAIIDISYLNHATILKRRE